MKKVCVALLVLFSMSFAAAKGGCTPCMGTVCFGPRVGLEMNEGTRLTAAEKNRYRLDLAYWIIPIPSVDGLAVVDYFQEPFFGESMNEIREREKLGGVPVQAKTPKVTEVGGCGPLFGTTCFGSRVGLEMNDGRKIRAMEWWSLVPIVGIVPEIIMLKEAWDGKTMSEVVAEEGLDTPDPVKTEDTNKENKNH